MTDVEAIERRLKRISAEAECWEVNADWSDEGQFTCNFRFEPHFDPTTQTSSMYGDGGKVQDLIFHLPGGFDGGVEAIAPKLGEMCERGGLGEADEYVQDYDQTVYHWVCESDTGEYMGDPDEVLDQVATVSERWREVV